MSARKTVKLAEVLRLDLDRAQVDAATSYPMVGVLSFGRGLFDREPVQNGNTSYRFFYRLKPTHVVMSQLFGWEGALALSSEAFSGKFLSPQFPTFLCDEERLDREFLGWLMRRPAFWEDLGSRASGMGDRRRTLNPNALFECEIPLPPLPEQRRVVARIEVLVAKITKAGGLRRQAAEEVESLYPRIRDKTFGELTCERKPIGDIFDLVNGRAFKPDEWQEEGRRIIRIQNLKYLDASYNYCAGPVAPQHLVHSGDVLFAWSGQIVSLGAHIWRHEEAVLNQHIFNVRARTEMMPEFVKEGFNALIDEMKDQVRGLEMFHIRKQELVQLLFPVPPLYEQRRIVGDLAALQSQVAALKILQAETGSALDALLPSVLDGAFRGDL